MRSFRSQKGAAMLIVLLLIALISAAAFSIGQQMITEIILSRNLDNSIIAYYAAEAGLQDGLLRYKLDHNYQKTPLPQTVTLDNQAKYELEVKYKASIAGALGSISGKLVKDMPLDLDVSWDGDSANVDDGVRTIVFTIEKAVQKGGAGDELIGVELTQFDKGNQVSAKNYYDCRQFSDVFCAPGQMKIDRLNLSKVRLKAFIKSDQKDAYVDYEVSHPDFSGKALIDSGTTSIIATGFAGQSARKLELKIDRATGATIGFFDYALYAAGGDIK